MIKKVLIANRGEIAVRVIARRCKEEGIIFIGPLAETMEAYNEQFSNPYRAAEQGFIDEVMMPCQTRRKLIQALEMAKNKSQSNLPKKHGNMPL